MILALSSPAALALSWSLLQEVDLHTVGPLIVWGIFCSQCLGRLSLVFTIHHPLLGGFLLPLLERLCFFCTVLACCSPLHCLGNPCSQYLGRLSPVLARFGHYSSPIAWGNSCSHYLGRLCFLCTPSFTTFTWAFAPFHLECFLCANFALLLSA